MTMAITMTMAMTITTTMAATITMPQGQWQWQPQWQSQWEWQGFSPVSQFCSHVCRQQGDMLGCASLSAGRIRLVSGLRGRRLRMYSLWLRAILGVATAIRIVLVPLAWLVFWVGWGWPSRLNGPRSMGIRFIINVGVWLVWGPPQNNFRVLNNWQFFCAPPQQFFCIFIFSWFQFTFNWFQITFIWFSIGFNLLSIDFNLLSIEINWFSIDFNLFSIEINLLSIEINLLSIDFNLITSKWFQFTFNWVQLISIYFQGFCFFGNPKSWWAQKSTIQASILLSNWVTHEVHPWKNVWKVFFLKGFNKASNYLENLEF